MAGTLSRENTTASVETDVWRADASSVRQSAAAFWQNVFFASADRFPRVTRVLAPLWARLAWLASPTLREGPAANARWLPGVSSPPTRRRRFARRVVTSFFRFVCDLAEGGRLPPDTLRTRIHSVEGKDHYTAARRLGKGAIVATAHLGSFEVGLASLRAVEPRMHVVFQRDRVGRFDRMRSRLHRRLGVEEAPVDEGWEAWARLRDALYADEVVLMQADRTMPGQRGRAVPFFGGHIRLPLGTVKLARLTGAPIIPVFALRGPGGVRLSVDTPITVDDGDEDALLALGRAIERHVRRAPEQWLVLYRAWCEDQMGPEAQRPSVGTSRSE